MQSDCLYRYSSVFFKHYNWILLCDGVPGRYIVSLRAYADHNGFEFHQSLARVGFYFLNMPFSCPTLDVVLHQVLRVSKQLSVILWSYYQRHCKTFCDFHYLSISYGSVLCR